MNVLVVAPHPDDEVLGCGGTIARHAACGDDVNVLIMSRGAPDVFLQDDINQTRAEVREAHCLLGVKEAKFLDFPAPKLDAVPGHQLADAISDFVKQTQPELVYLPHRGDLHVDHHAVYLAGLVASRPINGCPVKKVLSYETLSETEWGSPHGDAAFTPTVFADVTDYLDAKMEALSCVKSQLKAPPHSRSLDAIEHLARLRGATVGLKAAEAFMLEREIN